MITSDDKEIDDELGLLDEDDLTRITTLILEQYPRWKSSGVNVVKRVDDWHEAHRDP